MHCRLQWIHLLRNPLNQQVTTYVKPENKNSYDLVLGDGWTIVIEQTEEEFYAEIDWYAPQHPETTKLYDKAKGWKVLLEKFDTVV